MVLGSVRIHFSFMILMLLLCRPIWASSPCEVGGGWAVPCTLCECVRLISQIINYILDERRAPHASAVVVCACRYGRFLGALKLGVGRDMGRGKLLQTQVCKENTLHMFVRVYFVSRMTHTHTHTRACECRTPNIWTSMVSSIIVPVPHTLNHTHIRTYTQWHIGARTRHVAQTRACDARCCARSLLLRRVVKLRWAAPHWLYAGRHNICGCYGALLLPKSASKHTFSTSVCVCVCVPRVRNEVRMGCVLLTLFEKINQPRAICYMLEAYQLIVAKYISCKALGFIWLTCVVILYHAWKYATVGQHQCQDLRLASYFDCKHIFLPISFASHCCSQAQYTALAHI